MLLALIPKQKCPRKTGHYRLISPCKVAYKICAKALVNRLRPILNEIITENQNAFVKGRVITYNVFMATELISTI